jgi:hypothetical protein
MDPYLNAPHRDNGLTVKTRPGVVRSGMWQKMKGLDKAVFDSETVIT